MLCTVYISMAQGFYAVYGEVFKKISLEDQDYMNGVNTAPEFGNSLNTYEEVSIVWFIFLSIDGFLCHIVCCLINSLNV